MVPLHHRPLGVRLAPLDDGVVLVVDLEAEVVAVGVVGQTDLQSNINIQILRVKPTFHVFLTCIL